VDLGNHRSNTVAWAEAYAYLRTKWQLGPYNRTQYTNVKDWTY